jgi:hypothetical protein
MMSHQAGNTIADIDPAQKAGTVERVKASFYQLGGVSNIVKPSRRDKIIRQ